MTRVGLFLAGATSLVMLAGSAAIAGNATGTITSLQGKVLISSKHGFIAARANQSVKPGDRLLVGTDSEAALGFPGCSVPLAPGKVHVVSATPCAPAADPMTTASIAPTAATTPAGNLGHLEGDQIRLHRMSLAAEKQLDEARKSRDLVRTQCVAGKLDTLRILASVYDKSMQVYKSAFESGETSTAEGEATRMKVAAAKAGDVSMEAAACQGERVELRTETVDVSGDPTGQAEFELTPLNLQTPQPTSLFTNEELITTAGSIVAVGIGFTIVHALNEKPVSAP